MSRGAAYVRPRYDNHARSAELIALEARVAEQGLWRGREHRVLNARDAGEIALAADVNCLRGAAPLRIVEARVTQAPVLDPRAALQLEGSPVETPFSVVVFGQSSAQSDGAPLASLASARIRVRGPLGVYREAPQLCLDHSSALEVVEER